MKEDQKILLTNESSKTDLFISTKSFVGFLTCHAVLKSKYYIYSWIFDVPVPVGHLIYLFMLPVLLHYTVQIFSSRRVKILLKGIVSRDFVVCFFGII
jgi:hypothetical protein